MKVGNTINGLTITDVKRVNKLNLIQFLKEVDSYLQKGYQIDVNSARQVGLVLQAYLYKVEQHFGGVGSTEVGSVGDATQPSESNGKEIKEDSVAEQQKPDVVEEAPKKAATRSKRTAQ